MGVCIALGSLFSALWVYCCLELSKRDFGNINALPPVVYTKLRVGGCVGSPVRFGICLGLLVQKVRLHPQSFLHHAPHIEIERYGTVLPWWMKVNAVECLWSCCLDVFNLVEEAGRGWGGVGVNGEIVLAVDDSGCAPRCATSPPPNVSRSFVRCSCQQTGPGLWCKQTVPKMTSVDWIPKFQCIHRGIPELK